MFNSFDPKERKALLWIFALIVLGVAYFSTHEVSWEQQPTYIPPENSLDYSPDAQPYEPIPSQPKSPQQFDI